MTENFSKFGKTLTYQNQKPMNQQENKFNKIYTSYIIVKLFKSKYKKKS